MLLRIVPRCIGICLILLLFTTLHYAQDVPITNMQPAPNTTTLLQQGDEFIVSVDANLVVIDADVATDVSCILWWDGADGILDSNWDATPMTADAETDSVNRYTVTIDTSDLQTGYYGFTTRCDYDDQQFWFGDYHSVADGTLALESPIAPATPILRMRPDPGSLAFRVPQSTEPLEVSIDFYLLGVTDREGQGEGVSCLVWADFADGIKDDNWEAIPMTYSGDAIRDIVDRYTVEINIADLPEETYGFTTRCDHDGTAYWFNENNPDAGGDARLMVTTEDPEVVLARPDQVEGVDYVGNLQPRGGVANVYRFGTERTLNYTVEVYEPDVTEASGQGENIECFLSYGLFDTEPTTALMTYQEDKGNNDEYAASLDIAGWAAGNYAVDAYCTTQDSNARLFTVPDLGRPINEGASIITIIPETATPPAGTVFVHLFEWKWTDIAAECSFLADVGYSAIQVSPPQEHIVLDTVENDPWWTRYQPVSYILNSRSGTEDEFVAMVEACNAVDVDIYVDAVINHMSGQTRSLLPGTAGTVYSHKQYGDLYSESNFHDCGSTANDIGNYNRRFEVQNCELLNLADLRTETDYVREQIRTYLQALIDLGVAGFRIDASKHMPAHDITAIIIGLEGNPYIFQEVIGSPNEPILPQEYIINGDVTEFAFSRKIGQAFNCGNVADLRNVTEGLLQSDNAIVFVDNHDNQRGHGAGGLCILDHTDGLELYDLGTVFMLAYPYGYPKVMSSYWWDDGAADADNNPPPSVFIYTDGEITGCNDTDWVCEHRRTAITSMVDFRRVTDGTPLTDWQIIGLDQIAFGRGDVGFVVINGDEELELTNHTVQTSLPAGDYCDVISGGLAEDRMSCTGTIITVAEDGTFSATLAPLSAVAIHQDARLGS